jgi:hypothetical protein
MPFTPSTSYPDSWGCPLAALVVLSSRIVRIDTCTHHASTRTVRFFGRDLFKPGRCNSFANRPLRDDINQPLIDRQRTHSRGLRVALGTGYSQCSISRRKNHAAKGGERNAPGLCVTLRPWGVDAEAARPCLQNVSACQQKVFRRGRDGADTRTKKNVFF